MRLPGARRKNRTATAGPDEIRDEVLGRLLALNAERAAEEAREGKKSATRRFSTTVRPRTTAAEPAFKVAEAELPWDSPMTHVIKETEIEE